jgi:hypothetical protein
VDEEYQDQLQRELDEAEDVYEDQKELQEAQQEMYDATYPTVKPESNIYNLFWKVLKLPDSTKVGNLDKEEIGNLQISVRECQKLGMLGTIFHHPTFGNFFFTLAEITSKTSMAKKGWFSELFVSQKKFATRSRKISNLKKNRWNMFGKTQPTQQEEAEP